MEDSEATILDVSDGEIGRRGAVGGVRQRRGVRRWRRQPEAAMAKEMKWEGESTSAGSRVSGSGASDERKNHGNPEVERTMTENRWSGVLMKKKPTKCSRGGKRNTFIFFK
jgi:hypothetical protein